MIVGAVVDPLTNDYWPEALALLIPAIERSEQDQVELEAALGDGTALLWLGVAERVKAALVVRKDGDTMEIWLAGGAIIPLFPYLANMIEQAAIEAGMTRGRVNGRKGWTRALKSWGWRTSGDDLVKDLQHG